jgi:hypothetical protein
VEDQNQGGAPGAQRGRTTLIVIFVRRHNARCEEDGPGQLCSAVTEAAGRRDCLRAGAGVTAWRQGPAPVRDCARGSGPDCRPAAVSAPSAPPRRRASARCLRSPLGDPCLCLESGRARPPGTPGGRALEDLRRESCHSSGRAGRSQADHSRPPAANAHHQCDH